MPRAKIAVWSRQTMQQLIDAYPGIARAFWWSNLIEQSIYREWLIGLGQRTAFERLSHLVCEIYFRLNMVGKVHDSSFEMPIAQAELGDTLGLTVVHINRTLQGMRREKLIRLSSGVMSVLDLERLQTISMFNPSYMRLGNPSIAVPASRKTVGMHSAKYAQFCLKSA
jgi:CRP-like cAMP-binding protein